MIAVLFGQSDGSGRPWLWVLPLVLGAVSVWGLLPRIPQRPWRWAALVGLAALLASGMTLLLPAESWSYGLLFYLFAGLAVVAAVCMITNRNPAYAALWFAVVTLCTCGLFLICSAPFLAAALTIVYAGAIIVTFLFLIMLAQQAVGSAVYDQQVRQPLAATLAGFVVLGGILSGLQQGFPPPPTVEVNAMCAVPTADAPGRGDTDQEVRAARAQVSPSHFISRGEEAGSAVEAIAPREVKPERLTPAGLPRLPATSARHAQPPPVDSLSQLQPQEDMGAVRGLGRTLFGRYLYAVELAGTLLLAAAIGAIAIGLRTPRGGRP